MAYKVDFSLAIGRPEVDIQNEHTVIDVIAIHFLPSRDICNNKSNARRGSNGTSILLRSARKLRLCNLAHLVSKTTHSRTARLLHNRESTNHEQMLFQFLISNLQEPPTRISIPSQYTNEVMDPALRAVFLELKASILPDYATPQVSALSL
jgi:hypothetical protein